MNYEAWRISHQSSEQAARSAYEECGRVAAEAAQKQDLLVSALCRISGIASARCAEDLEKIEEIANEALDELMRGR